MSKSGDALLRTMLYKAAHSLLTHGSKWSWLQASGLRVAQRRGIRRAIVEVARRLAVVLHRMWVDGSEFRWGKDDAGRRRGSCGCLNRLRRTCRQANKAVCSGRKTSSRDDGWGEFVRSADPCR